MIGTPTAPPNYELLSARLADLRAALQAPTPVVAGQCVRWKRGLQHSPLLRANDVAVVLSVLAEPLLADDVPAFSDEYRLLLDVELATLDDDGLLCRFRTQSSLLEPVEAPGGRVYELLRATTDALARSEPLAAGRLVAWKPRCAPADIERPDRPALLLELLDDGPHCATRLSTEREFRQPSDAAVAVEDDLAGFRVHWTDRRRLTAYRGPVAAGQAPDFSPGRCELVEARGAGQLTAAAAGRLLARHAALRRETRLEPGMLVTWKPGLRDRLIPLDGDAAVVLEVFGEPRHDPEAPVGSACWRQPLSLALGAMGEDGHFVVAHYDARRFEPLGRRASEHRAFLLRSVEAYRRRHRFEAGELVRWKPGFMNRTLPAEQSTAVVLETLPAPVVSDHIEPTSTYFREPLDLVLGVLDDGSFDILHVDSARFRPARPDAAHGEEGRRLIALQSQLAAPPSTAPAPGRIVVWKDGLRPGPLAEFSERGVVLRLLDPPARSADQNSGSPLFRIDHTLEVGFLDDDDDLVPLLVDGRRLQAAAPDAIEDEPLADRYERFSAPRDFAPGALVVWADGLEDRGLLDLSSENPGIVLKRLDPPVTSPQQSLLSRDYGARADLLVGGLDDDGTFAMVHADSRRLSALEEPAGDVIRRLRGFRRRLRRRGGLRPGCLVAWKDRQRVHPGLPEGIPAVVLECRDRPEPLCGDLARGEFWGPESCAVWDAVLGVWNDGRLLRIHCDSRCIEPFDPEVHGAILRQRATEEAQRLDEFARMLDDFDEDEPPF